MSGTVYPGRLVTAMRSALLLAAGGCTAGAGDPDGLTVDTLSNGAVHVQNGARGVWGDSQPWRLVEDLRIGARDGTGPEVFSDIMRLSLAVDQGGAIYVLDAQAGEVRVFDTAGTHVLTFGRSGGGPGEFRSPSLAGFAPDGNLWVVDQRAARYTAFAPSGEVVRTERREILSSIFPWQGGIDDQGRAFDVGFDRDARTVGPSVELLRVAPGGVVDTFPLPYYDGDAFYLLNDAGRPMRAVSIPFAGRLVWRLDPRGYVWTAITDRYRIVQRKLAGDTVRIVERAVEPIPVSSEMRAEAIERLADFREAGGQVDESRVPSTMPPIVDFLVDERGYLWVRQSRSGPPGGPGWDVFDPEGRYLGVVPASTGIVLGMSRPVFRGDHLYGFTMDDLHVPYLVRLRLERSRLEL